MAIHAVIFDLYGVLGLNGWQDFKMRHFDGRWDAWEPLRVLGQKVDAGEATDDEFVAALSAATGESKQAVRYSFEHTRPNTELLQFIQNNLRGYKIGLLSNASHDVLPHLFTEKERALFDEVMLSVHEGITKPEASMFHRMCERLDLAPQQCILVDDQARHLAAAEQIGMKTVLFTDNTQVTGELMELTR